jgi:DNA-binding GntR family transcriptional regulator
MERIDTRRAYELIREKITTLALAPGAPIDAGALADELEMALLPVQEALKLLAHEELVIITRRHGLYVSDVNIEDLHALSETRLPLEGLCARLAAERATADDLVVLEALCTEAPAGSDGQELFELDHRFHQAIAAAAHNRYLARTLEQFFGLSQRLWILALPHLDFLPSAVEEHVEIVEAIKAGNGDEAERRMREHVRTFYDNVGKVLAEAVQERNGETGGQEDRGTR